MEVSKLKGLVKFISYSTYDQKIFLCRLNSIYEVWQVTKR